MRVYTGCTDVREDFSALLDDELAVDEREAIEAHLSECSDCLRALDGMKRVDLLFRAAPAVEAHADFDARLRDVTKPRLLRFPKRIPSLNRGASMMAAAAALLVVAGVSFLTMRDSGAPESVGPIAQEPQPAPVMRSPGGGGGAINDMHDADMASGARSAEGASAQSEVPAAQLDASESAEARQEVRRRVGGIEMSDAASLRNEPAPAEPSQDRQMRTATPPPPAAPAPVEEEARYQEIPSETAARTNTKDETAQAERPVEQAAAQLKAAAEPAAPSVGGRTIERREGNWYEAAYTGESTTVIQRTDNRLRAMIAKEPALRRYLQLNDPVIFRYENTWYKLVPRQ